MKLPIYNLKREEVGQLDLADEVFGTEVKEHLLWEVVRAQLASRRQGTKATKERSAVRGSSKKLYRQKGTGNARQGSKRAPHHARGGMAHALAPQDWSYRPPRKVRIAALKSALSLFAKEGRLVVVDQFDISEPKTKLFAQTVLTLTPAKADAPRSGKPKKSIVVDASTNEKLVLSLRNLATSRFMPPEGLNVYDLLKHDHLIVTKDAAKALEARCLK